MAIRDVIESDTDIESTTTSTTPSTSGACGSCTTSAYFPIVITIWVLGAIGLLPRVKPSTQNEGHERRYFYGSVWAVCIAQPVLWFLWWALPRSAAADAIKLAVFIGILAYVGNMARRGLLPRTRPILPGEIAVSD